MKELTLKEIQQESLKILQDVHRFCEDNGIRYSIAYGTMIGAVRHKGFIPWDNDIDIYMPRPDYKRFCESYQSERYKIISEYNPGCYINYCHIYDDRDTTCYSPFIMADNFQGGIWIDVFPMDGAPDDHDAFEKKMLRMSKVFNKMQYLRKAACGLSTIKKAFGWKEFIILSFYYFLTPTKLLLKKTCERLRKEAQEFPFGTTSRWTDYSCIYIGDDNFHEIKAWSHIGLAEFEGERFRMLEDYDAILSRRYGNYMQLPPENKRIPKGNHHIYWKNEQ